MIVTRRSVFRLAGVGVAAVLANCLPKRAFALAKRPVDLTGNPRISVSGGSVAYRYIGGRTGPFGQIDGYDWEVHRTPDGKLLAGSACQIVDPSTSEEIRFVHTCDTGTGELKVFVPIPRKGPQSRSLGQYQSFKRLDTRVDRRDFDVVHRRTGEVLHRVRWV